jgi:hypothetical protein
MENQIMRPRGGTEIRQRLIDLCNDAIRSHRGVLETAEHLWANELAAALYYQDDPVRLALSSVFTKLRSITRVRWQLEDPPPDARQAIEADLAAIERLLKADTDRASVVIRLQSVGGELGETLRYELSTLPPDSWRMDLREVIRQVRLDLDAGSVRVLASFERLRKQIFVRHRARARVTGSVASTKVAAHLLETLLTKLPEGRAAGPRAPQTSSLLVRLEQRHGHLAARPVHVGFQRPGAKSGTYVMMAKGPSYMSRSPEDALDFLAMGAFTGWGASAFTSIARAGLAYSAWAAPYASRGSIVHYADRSPDLLQTMKFAARIADSNTFSDTSSLDYALANCFTDFRGDGTFSSRGAALAADLADGFSPEQVSGFKRLLLETAASKDVLARVRARIPEVLGRVVVGYGAKVSDSPGAVGLVIGSEELLDRYEAFLKEQGEADRLIRIFPRDFWPLSDDATTGTALSGDQGATASIDSGVLQGSFVATSLHAQRLVHSECSPIKMKGESDARLR